MAELDPLRRDLFIFALHTGVRKANAALLKREYISSDLSFVCYPGTVMKNGLPFEKALNEETRTLVAKNIRKGQSLQEKYDWLPPVEYVFVQDDGPHMGKPLKPGSITNRVWREARKRAGLPESLVFHSARHYMASAMLRAGVPQPVVQKAGGWADPKSMFRYSHVVDKQMFDAAETTGRFLT